MPASDRDAVDHHVARWAEYWRDNPKFQPEVEGAMTRMGTILQRRDRAEAADFQSSDFTLEDFKTLHVLVLQPYPTEATPAQLAEASHVTRAAMTSRLDRLAESKLVTRDVDPLDRRRVIIRPTAAGRAAWESYVDGGMAHEQKILSALTADEVIQLNALLRKVLLALDD
jgi:DNA-binding MarR family transcriptional regulator